MNDAGFANVTVIDGAAADTECNQHWKSVDGHFMARNITDADQSKPQADRLEHRFAAAIAANTRGTVSIPAGMEERIPFFDFYVFAESSNPPSATEFAHSEGFVTVTGSVGGVIPATATKTLVTPIVIAIGSAGSQLRKHLAAISTSDHANTLANTICHEVGHTFGLRHSVAFRGSPPYETGDAEFGRGTMGPAGLLIGSGTPRVPVSFFGPVQLLEIRRLYL